MFKLATFPGLSFALAKLEPSCLRRWFVEFWAGVGEARVMAAQYEYLSRLSTSDLARLGLTRDDITRIVARGR